MMEMDPQNPNANVFSRNFYATVTDKTRQEICHVCQPKIIRSLSDLTTELIDQSLL